ncbi:MAG TPA: P1 family peptidase [Longimicrobiales bacterium]|nr:P1 family peptidase [Longimicrobiales bacterium]
MDVRGITAVEGLELGHHTLSARPTGCTVILARAGAVGGVDIRGSAPGTRETALLDPVNPLAEVYAVVLSGGSAFGLDVSTGVMRYLEERDIGYRIGRGVVPIVVGAILYDLGLEGTERVRPGPECGYAAASAASTEAPDEGSVGAGAGATVGKFGGTGRPMRGGFGTASVTLESGLTVAAAVAVNAVGDIVDPATGQIVAGARTEDGRGFADARQLLRSGRGTEAGAPGMNTTIGVVATNATLTKAEATKVAQMAQDGLARTIYPAHTTRDGDTVFSLATGAWEGTADVTVIGGLAADVMSEAILRAVRLAEGLPGIPSVNDLPN